MIFCSYGIQLHAHSMILHAIETYINNRDKSTNYVVSILISFYKCSQYRASRGGGGGGGDFQVLNKCCQGS